MAAHIRAGAPWRRALLLPVLLALVSAGCRDAPEPFAAADRSPQADLPRRLTYSPLRDRGPVWSTDGDTVYYAADRPYGLLRGAGVLMAIPRNGGARTPILADLQTGSGVQRSLVAPVPSPDGARLAYAEVWAHRIDDLCVHIGAPDVVTTCAPSYTPFAPFLTEVRLRVRERGATRPVEDDPELAVRFDEVRLDRTRHPFSLEGVLVVPLLPAQDYEREQAAHFYRPTWSPSGNALAFADGYGLRIWDLAASGSRTIPGTEDAVSAAWSPDGTWIAYTRLERTDTLITRCVQSAFGSEFCVVEQFRYPIGRRTLTLVRPDGAGGRELGEGEQAAWLPDGTGLVVRREDALWTVGLDGSAGRISGTTGGGSPAVSPDGRFLAFVRRSSDGAGDIWITAMP